MKQILYYLSAILLTIAISSCSDDKTKDTPTDPKIQAERNALLKATNFCIQKNGNSIFALDKKAQQIHIMPSVYTFELLSHSGKAAVEVILASIPTADKSTTGIYTDKTKNTTVNLKALTLLQNKNDMLYLWDDETHTGIVVPWFELE